MSDETIAVTIQETTLPVSIDTGTPQISIIEQSGDVTIIEANPIQVIATEGDATVVINSGVYGSADPINVEDLVGYITRLQLDPDLTTDMEHLDAMWTQIGGKTVLLGSDGIAIRLAGQAYTDSSILTATTDISIDVDSKISNSAAANSLITDALDDRITSVNVYIEESSTAINNRITSINADLSTDINDKISNVTAANSLITDALDDRITLIDSNLSLDIDEVGTVVDNLGLRVTSIQQDTNEVIGTINTSLYDLGQTITNNKMELDDRLDALDLFVGTTDDSIYSVVSRLNAIDGATGSIVDLQSSIEQTADSINLWVTSLETSVDGRITSAEGRISITEDYIESAVLKFSEIDGTTTDLSSYIQQTASSIDSRITSVETSIDGRFDTAESRIYQTEQGILSTVQTLSGITGDDGSLYSLGSRIDQQAGSIEMAVQESSRINGKLIETSSGLSLLTDSVGLFVDKYDEVAGRVTEAEIILGVDGINISLIESALGLQSYTIGTIQNILTNQWTVNVSEDVAGNVYTTGFGLVLHPIWLVDEAYTTGFIVTADTAVYECILSHTSSATNSPLLTGGASYWELLPDGVKSEFNIQADAFRIMTSSGPVPVFEVTDDVITLHADVAIEGILTVSYDDVVGAPTSLEELDSEQYTKLLGMELGATANNVYFQNTEPEGTMGDLWLDTDDDILYTHDGSTWIAVSSGTEGLKGEDGASIAWKGSLSAAPSDPEELWAYYNTTDRASYVYSDSAWYQMSVDGTPGTPGTSITWKGNSASPPANPELNWAYYDTDNGIAYIWNGNGWEVLAQDGLDGYDGQGMVKGIAFYRSTTTPATPTGGSFSSPTPTTADWDDGVPSGTNPLYMSSRLFTSDGASPQETSWCTPQKVSDLGQGTKLQFSVDGSTWHDSPATTDVYMRTGTSTDGGAVWIYTGAVKIKGESGTGITSVVNYYAINNSSTTAPTTWSTTVQTPTSTNKYLWNKETIDYSTGTPTTTVPAVIGTYSTDGVGISSVTEQYALSTSSSSVTGTWSSSVPTLTSTNKYLWNKETINYTDSTSSTTNPVVIGVYGDAGTAAQTIRLSATSQIFSVSSGGVSTPTSIDVTADLQNISGTIIWTISPAITTTAITNGKRITYANMGSNTAVTLTATIGNVSDKITLVKVADGSSGSNGYTVLLTNEAHTYPADETGSITGGYTPGYCQVNVYNGTTKMTCASTSTTAPTVNGEYRVTAVSVTSGTMSTSVGIVSSQYEFRPTAMSTDNATVQLTIVAQWNNIDTTFTKTISYSKSKSGADGNSIEFIFKRQATSTAPTTPSTSQTDDYVPSGWTDDPTGVNSTYKYEFSCQRTKSEGTWSAFSTPALWATYSTDGTNGTSTFTYYQTTTPTTGKVNELWFSSATGLLRRCTVANSTLLTDWPVVGNSFDNTNKLTDGALLGQTALWTSVTGRPTSLQTINSAEYARLPTASLGALAYINSITDANVTTISGGKISTGIIYGSSSYSYWNLNTNKMYFTASANLTFASNAIINFGSGAKLLQTDGGAYLALHDDEITLMGPDSQWVNVNENYIDIYTNDFISLNAGTSQKILFKFGVNTTIQANLYGIRPYTTYDSNSLRQLLGDSGYEWAACYAHTFYDDGGGFLDLQDDLAVMAEFKPRKEVKINPETREKTISGKTEINPKSGFEYLDILSIPRWMTNYDEVFKKLKEENGDLLSEEDIDELIQDREEAGWLLNRNLGAFNDLTSGAVRQMDLENKEMYELIFSRLTALEKENKELKERVTVLEGEKVK